MFSFNSFFVFTLFFIGLSFCFSLNFNFDDYIQVPGGVLMHYDCVHEVPHGSNIENYKENDYVLVNDYKIPKCKHPFYFNHELKLLQQKTKKQQINEDSLPAAGWQAWTAYQHPNNETFTTFNGYFTVPDEPTNWGPSARSGIVYIFTGLQNENWVPNSGGIAIGASKDFEIIQPVLQYGGGSYNGGGLYWGIASWYVTIDAGAFYSTELKVSPGDNIYGVMEAQGPITWRIDSVTPSAQNSSLTITRQRLINNPWAYCTLEVYNIKDCSWLPPSNSASHFTQMILKDANGTITPTWEALTETSLGGPSQNPCSSSFTVINPSTVDLQCQS